MVTVSGEQVRGYQCREEGLPAACILLNATFLEVVPGLMIEGGREEEEGGGVQSQHGLLK